MKKQNNQKIKNYLNSKTLISALFFFSFLLVSMYFLITNRYSVSDPIFIEVYVTSSEFWYGNTKQAPLWLSESLAIGDTDSDKQPTATITDKKIIDLTGAQEFSSVDSFRRNKETELAKEAFVKLQLKVERKNNMYLYKGKPIQVGAPIQIPLQKVLLSGVVTEIPSEKIFKEEKMIEIEGTLNDRSSLETKFIKEGLENKDKAGRSTFKITESSFKPASLISFDDRGNVYVKNNPLAYDIQVKILLSVDKKNDTFIFGRTQEIKTGNFISLYTPEINLLNLKIESVKETP